MCVYLYIYIYIYIHIVCLFDSDPFAPWRQPTGHFPLRTRAGPFLYIDGSRLIKGLG